MSGAAVGRAGIQPASVRLEAPARRAPAGVFIRPLIIGGG